MTTVPSPKPLFQQFRLLPLQEQIKLSAQINQFLAHYFDALSKEHNDLTNWQALSKQALSKAYSEDEPDYS
jgi:hypothetical protein